MRWKRKIRKKRESNESAKLSFPVPGKWLAPHSLLFLVFNAGYYFPLLVILMAGYSGPGGKESLEFGLNYSLLAEITFVYVSGVVAFFLGSKLGPIVTTLTARPPIHERLRPFELNAGFRAFCWFSVAVFVATKVLLIPRGVYANYAFETGKMTGGLWSFSMFWSELLLFLSIVVLFSNSRHNLKGFLLLNLIDGINLLHGTRIFFIIAGVTLCFYLYVRGKMGFKRLVVFATSLLAGGYLVFLFRSHVALNEHALSFSRVISPIMYESIFSQFSLIGVAQRPALWGHQIFPLHFLSDVLWFSVPRFLFPGKGELLYISQFSYLSPMGAFSGYAEGLLYFGLLMPVFYFFLGIAGDWLLRQSRFSQFWSVVYVYFTCDFLFRIMRDGYVIPAKMLINNVMVLVFIIYFVSPQVRLYSFSRLKHTMGAPPQRPAGAESTG